MKKGKIQTMNARNYTTAAATTREKKAISDMHLVTLLLSFFGLSVNKSRK